MKRSISFLAAGLFLVALLLPLSIALASETASGGGSAPEAPYVVTERIKAEILDVNEEGVLKIRYDDTGKEQVLQLSETVKLKAQSKKDFGGRRNLNITDLEAGQRIRITYRPDSGEILEVRVLKERA